MIIHELELKGAAVIDAEPYEDHRGLFARFFCSKELESLLHGKHVVNMNYSRTTAAGTIRGMHFQRPPHQEMKLIRCIRGAVFDVIVDIRKDSPTFLKWHGETLSAENMKMLCVPEGFAHGFQSLEPDSEVLYLTTAFYNRDAEGGIRYDDPALRIKWPLSITGSSQRDSEHPLITEDFEGVVL